MEIACRFSRRSHIATRMASPPARVVVIGGNSSIARHLLDLIPQARALARAEGGARTAAVGDYRALGPSDFAGADVVVNCAGIVSGSEAALQAVNVDLQRHLALAARDAGVGRYVAIGSFSVFGRCKRIGHASAIDPCDAYGRSKNDGDDALLRLNAAGFQTVSVAFPAIVGTTRAGKVEQMLRLWRRFGVWPVPASDIARSMIGALGAARVLAEAVKDDRSGRVLAADPVPFCYGLVAQWLREDVGGAFARLPLPQAGVALLGRASPSLQRSMMTDSLLDPEANYAVELGVVSSLRGELARSVTRTEKQ